MVSENTLFRRGESKDICLENRIIRSGVLLKQALRRILNLEQVTRAVEARVTSSKSSMRRRVCFSVLHRREAEELISQATSPTSRRRSTIMMIFKK
jgi:hypothetical protein